MWITVDICLQSQTSLTTLITPAQQLPSIALNIEDQNISANTRLADPAFNKSQNIVLMIGACMFYELFCVGQINIVPGLPLLQKTLLGWVVSGNKFSQILRASSPQIFKSGELTRAAASHQKTIFGLYSFNSANMFSCMYFPIVLLFQKLDSTTTKHRMVFDGLAITSSGQSFNEAQDLSYNLSCLTF